MQSLHFLNYAIWVMKMCSDQIAADNPPIGIRGRKNIMTRRRIAEASLRLYIDKGYAKTTLAEIANEAEISPRTFFLHFSNKEETLKYWWCENFTALLPDFIARQDITRNPAMASRDALLQLMATQDPVHSATIERLLQSNQSLTMHRLGFAVELEETLFGVLCAGWGPRYPAEILRTTAMVVVGTMRLAVDRWREDGCLQAVTQYLSAEFDRLSFVFDPALDA
jgi:AcrR family transcriptional regulator